MGHPVLRLNDGFDHTSPALNDEVKLLQTELNKDGYSLEPDGFFGADTESAVKRFQREHGLNDDGIVGPITWSALLETKTPDVANIIHTTFAASDASLLGQLTEANKYKAFVDKAAQQFNLKPCIIGGIGSRESHWGLILTPKGPGGTGDFTKRRFPTRYRDGALPPDGGGFGRGLMQIDFDAQEFARTGKWQDPEQNILYGCQVLIDGRETLRRLSTLDESKLLQGAIAAYNCGPGNVLTAIRSQLDLDYFTAGRNYSQDVLNRAGWFQLNGWT